MERDITPVAETESIFWISELVILLGNCFRVASDCETAGWVEFTQSTRSRLSDQNDGAFLKEKVYQLYEQRASRRA